MKKHSFGVIALLFIGMVVALTGIVYADQGVPAVPETQTLSTGTVADVVGLVTETDAGTWTLTNDPLVLTSQTIDDTHLTIGSSLFNEISQQLAGNGGSITGVWNPGLNTYVISQWSVPGSLLNTQIPGTSFTYQDIIGHLAGLGIPATVMGKGIHDGVLDPGQVQYTTTYDASIVAQAGHTSLVKNMNIDTRNKVLGQSNVNAQTGLTFVATSDGGNAVGSENILIDGAGQNTTAADRILCPFATVPNGIIPAYCNIIQAGSTYDLTVGSVTTNANDRFVGTDATNPVVLNYAINVKPYGTSQGQIPAIGSTSAYIKAHIQEARNVNNVNITFPIAGGFATGWVWVPSTPQKTEDITYSESSSAQGTITAFNKEMSYSSQVTSLAIATPVPTMIAPT